MHLCISIYLHILAVGSACQSKYLWVQVALETGSPCTHAYLFRTVLPRYVLATSDIHASCYVLLHIATAMTFRTVLRVASHCRT